jgi:hypothetical protein
MAKSHNYGSGKAIYGHCPKSDDADGVADTALGRAEESAANVINGPVSSDKRDSEMPEAEK